MQAGDIGTPHGTLAMCYDSRGFLYELPQYLFSSPTNILSAEEAARPKKTHHNGATFEVPLTIRVSASVSALPLLLCVCVCVCVCVSVCLCVRVRVWSLPGPHE